MERQGLSLFVWHGSCESYGISVCHFMTLLGNELFNLSIQQQMPCLLISICAVGGGVEGQGLSLFVWHGSCESHGINISVCHFMILLGKNYLT